MQTFGRSTFLIGIAGGSAAGKTTLAKAIVDKVGNDKVSYIGHDWYYKDLRHLAIEDRLKTNFDHPDSLDTKYLIEQLKQILAGKKISAPQYDFKNYMRLPTAQEIEPRAILIVDGILALFNHQLRKLYDLKIFVDVCAEERLSRRLERDRRERGYSVEEIIRRYRETVKPMHDKFVEPCKQFADLIIPDWVSGELATEIVICQILARIEQRKASCSASVVC